MLHLEVRWKYKVDLLNEIKRKEESRFHCVGCSEDAGRNNRQPQQLEEAVLQNWVMGHSLPSYPSVQKATRTHLAMYSPQFT